MDIGIIGTGYVADYYLGTLRLHPELRVKAITDRDPARRELVGRNWGVPVVDSVEALLADSDIRLIVNLTNPREHAGVSRRALQAGKHVYSEKPVAMAFEEAKELVALARSRGLQIVSAPCSVLSETAQTLWRALQKEVVGVPRLVYAEMDDGFVPKMVYRQWLSTSGFPWPYKDEFEVGCTIEHAAYVVSWLAMWFGPVLEVTAFSAALLPEQVKVPGEALSPADAPDFSVACLVFRNGVVARLTCGIVAPHDHKLTVIGDDGILYTDETWNYRARVFSRKMIRIRRRSMMSPLRTEHPLPPPPFGKPRTRGSQSMDFARGVAELAAAIEAGRECEKLSMAFSLHVNEVVLAISEAQGGRKTRITTDFPALPPGPWL
ncbi:MAG TPA: Gfo/Idh/MocA family oxidoreductase [Roseateles sp.]